VSKRNATLVKNDQVYFLTSYAADRDAGS